MGARFLALGAVSIFCSTSVVQAQNLDTLISDCLSAIGTDGQAAEATANAIIESGSISDPNDREDALKCVKAVKGEEWSYSVALGRFLSAEQLAEAKRQAELQAEINFAEERMEKVMLEAAEAFNIANRVVLADETYQSCIELYSQNKSEALLNGVCQQAFRDAKHPKMPDRLDYLSWFIAEKYPDLTEAERIAIELLGSSGGQEKQSLKNRANDTLNAGASLSDLQRCWNVGSLGTEALRSTVVVEFMVDETARPLVPTIKIAKSNAASKVAELQAYEAGRRAIIRCGVNGYREAKSGDRALVTFNAERMQVSFEVQ
jgi:hypothetical protein